MVLLGRRGLTLLELLAVIAVIAILVAMLMPALINARRRALEAKVKTELTGLAFGLTQFQGTMGDTPPSNFTLYVDKAGWDSDPVSMSFIRRIWPNFDASNWAATNPTNDPAIFVPPWAPNQRTLLGAECLTFFLGGIERPVDTVAGVDQFYIAGKPSIGFAGFSKDPKNPFKPIVGDETRDGPYYDFKVDRLTDADADGFPEYADSLGTGVPVIYLCSNGKGFGRVPQGSGNDGACPDACVYSNNPTVADPRDLTFPYFSFGSSPAPINRGTYQLISAGFDGEYGMGGMWDESGTKTMVSTIDWILNNSSTPSGQYYTPPQCNPGITAGNRDAAIKARQKESDNITNFSTTTTLIK